MNGRMDMDLSPSSAPATDELVPVGISAAPPYAIHAATAVSVPLVFASPHSGAAYPADFIAGARLDAHGLRRSEDCFVDELFAAAPAHGAPLLAATFPRAWCDANREPWELDPTMFEEKLPSWVNTASPRVGAGLGTIARVVASGEPIYRRKLRFAEAEQRVRDCWHPYHAALDRLVAESRARFGHCLLIDCHSMPSGSVAQRGPGRDRGDEAEIVLGDVHGTSCAPRITRLVEQHFAALGYRVRRNDPYAGGYTTRHHGRPRHGVHALQIEIARSCYMDEQRLSRLARFAEVRDDITGLIAALAGDAERLFKD
jgi:N-formylglutamate amidohydrolase